MYNDAAVEDNGAPIIEEYRFSVGRVEIKFAHQFMTEAVSPKFQKEHGKGGWMTLIDGAATSKSINKKMDKNHNFTG